MWKKGGREEQVGRRASEESTALKAQLKPASLDIGPLVWQQFPVLACSIYEMEQWERTKDQSPGSSTCLPPLSPTPSRNEHKEKLFSEDLSCTYKKTPVCLKHVAGRQRRLEIPKILVSNFLRICFLWMVETRISKSCKIVVIVLQMNLYTN